MFSTLFRLMGMMFLLMISGYVLRKKELITSAGKKCLTDIILYAILPCNIIKAFSVRMEDGFLINCIQVLAAAILTQFIALLIAKLMYNRMKDGEKQVFQYATVCSNSNFMGNPLAEGVFGDIGLLYASVFLIPQRVVMWTAGVSYFQKGGNRKEVYKKILTHPCMIATYIGFFIMIFQISLPGVIADTVKAFSSCCTAMSMMYIGTILVDVDFKTLFSMKQVYFAVIRLILIPAVVLAGCTLAGIEPIAAGVCTLLSGTPAGSNTSLLAAKYEADEVSAAKAVVFTTVLSIITIPIWSMILMSRL